MTFKEEILTHYLDSELLVTKDRNPSHWSTGNGLLFTGIFYTLLYLRGECTAEDVDRFCMAVTPCWKDDELGNPIPGLLERNDKRNELQAHDDYRGVCVASLLLNTPHAKAVEAYGSSHFWCFNNAHPGRIGFRSWFGRFAGFPGLVRLCSRKSPGPLQAFLLGSDIFADSQSKAADPKILAWLSVIAAKFSAQANCLDAISHWENKIAFEFGSINQVFAESFGTEHPFAAYNHGLGAFGTGNLR